MARFVRLGNVAGMLITIDKSVLEKATRKINKVLSGAADEFVRSAKSRAPYDEHSRHAEGETKFPEMHHRDSIWAGKMDRNAKKFRGKSYAGTGAMSHATNLGFLGIDGGKLVDHWFVKSHSGRGVWLEYGTTGKTKSGEYLVRRDKAGRRQAKNLKWSERTGIKIREHYATKPKRHFLPAMNAAKRYIKANLKNVV